MQPKAGAHLWDAAEAARLVQRFARDTAEAEFTSNLMVRSAVERQLEVLGEALNRLRRDDAETASRIPDLDRIVGMRNVLAHEYGDIDYEIVWRAATISVPSLVPVLDELVEEARRTAGL